MFIIMLGWCSSSAFGWSPTSSSAYKLLLTMLYLASFGLLLLKERFYLFDVSQCVLAASMAWPRSAWTSWAKR